MRVENGGLDSAGENEPTGDHTTLTPEQMIYRANLCHQQLNDLVIFVNKVNVALMLSRLLEDHNRTRNELLYYLQTMGFLLERSSLDRYFNGYRTPDLQFCRYFAHFLKLSDAETKGLVAAVRFTRRQKMIIRVYQELLAVC